MGGGPARGSWTVLVDGRLHAVMAEWDRYQMGGGRILVDGAVAEAWWKGLKWPGAQRAFVIAGRRFVVAKRGVTDEQLDLFGGQPGLGLPVAPPPPRGWVLVVALASLLLLMGVAAAVLTALQHGGPLR